MKSFLISNCPESFLDNLDIIGRSRHTNDVLATQYDNGMIEYLSPIYDCELMDYDTGNAFVPSSLVPNSVITYEALCGGLDDEPKDDRLFEQWKLEHWLPSNAMSRVYGIRTRLCRQREREGNTVDMPQSELQQPRQGGETATIRFDPDQPYAGYFEASIAYEQPQVGEDGVSEERGTGRTGTEQGARTTQGLINPLWTIAT